MKRYLCLLVAVLLTISLPATALAGELLAGWEGFTEKLGGAAEGAADDPDGAAAQVAEARKIYQITFADQVDGLASVKAQVDQGLDQAAKAAADGDSLGATIGAEFAEKTTLALIFHALATHLDMGHADEARPWFDVLAAKLKMDDKDELVQEMDAISAGTKPVKTEGEEVIHGLASRLAGKVAEEVDEALVAADPKGAEPDHDEALIKAAEGVGYFRAVREQADETLGAEEAAKVAGLLDSMYNALTDGDYAAAAAGASVKTELEELEGAEELSASELSGAIDRINQELTEAQRQVQAGSVENAKDLVGEAWASFVKVEAQIRKIDAARYVKIENIFAKIQETPKSAELGELRQTLTDIAHVESGNREAEKASVQEVVFTNFERVQPILFVILALLGIYPLYLVSRAFSWKHKAWRNIGIFIALLVVPVFMEAIGRLGVELEIGALQAFSFTANEYAKMVWTVLIFVAFLFAISGLRKFCEQFGVRAIGVRRPDHGPLPDKTEATQQQA